MPVLTYRRWIYLISALLMLALAWYFKVIIAYVLISGILSLIGQPVNEFLSRVEIKGMRVPSALGAVITMLSIIGVVAGALALFIPMVASEARRLSAISPDDVIAGIEAPVARAQELVNRFTIGSNPVNVETVLKQQLTGLFDVNAITNSLNYAVGVTGDVFIGVFAVLFITFFFLKDRHLFRTMLMLPCPTEHEDAFARVLSKSKELLTRYFIGILIEMSIVMTVIAIGMSALGVRNAILIGFVGGLFNVIPYLGPMIGAALGMSIGIATNSDGLMVAGLFTLLGKMAIVYACAQLLDNIVLQPMIYSQSVKAHPLEIFLIIIMAGNVAGVLGMIVAIPTYSILRVFAGEFLVQFKLFRGLSFT